MFVGITITLYRKDKLSKFITDSLPRHWSKQSRQMGCVRADPNHRHQEKRGWRASRIWIQDIFLA